MTTRDEQWQLQIASDPFFADSVALLTTACDDPSLTSVFFSNPEHARFFPELLHRADLPIEIWMSSLRAWIQCPQFADSFPYQDCVDALLRVSQPTCMQRWIRALDACFADPQLQPARISLWQVLLRSTENDVVTNAIAVYLRQVHCAKTLQPWQKSVRIALFFDTCIQMHHTMQDPSRWAKEIGFLLWTSTMRPLVRNTFTARQCNDFASQWLLHGHFVLLSYWKHITPYPFQNHELLRRMQEPLFWRTVTGRHCFEQWITLTHPFTAQRMRELWTHELHTACIIALLDPLYLRVCQQPHRLLQVAKELDLQEFLQILEHYVLSNMRDAMLLTCHAVFQAPQDWAWITRTLECQPEYAAVLDQLLVHLVLHAPHSDTFALFFQLFHIWRNLSTLQIMELLAEIHELTQNKKYIYQWIYHHDQDTPSFAPFAPTTTPV